MDYLYSFVFGGLLCVIAQLLIDKTKITPAYILVSYVCAGIILNAIGLYKPFIELAHSGATVPLTGFGSQLATGVREAVENQGLFGALTGGLTATAGGIAATICFAFIFSIIFKSKKS